MSDLIQIMSNGGGTQSAAMIALVIQGRLPRPDFIAIVDTGRERKTTWEYLDGVIRPALHGIGMDVHRIQKDEWATVDWLGGKNKTSVLLPAFSSQTQEPAKLDGFCSNEWKVRVMDRYFRKRLGIATSSRRRWIGYSLDEARRAVRMMNTEDYKAGRIYFPLIHGIPMKRQRAIDLVEKMGWPTPPRSACWNCPNQNDDEWMDLKLNSPEEFALAVDMEKEVQKVDPFCWFHRSCMPLSEVDFTPMESEFHEVFPMDRACSSGGCFT